MPLMTIEEARPAPPPSAGPALFALGFRPFYLLAAAFAAVAVPAWVAAQAGWPLAAIAGVWTAGRVTMLAAPPVVAAAVDVVFLPIAAVPLYRVLKQSGNRRNLFLVGLLALLALANACYHAAALGWVGVNPLTPVHAAIMLIVVIEIVIGGRVIPVFTRNAVPDTQPVQDARRDKWALARPCSPARRGRSASPRPSCCASPSPCCRRGARPAWCWLPRAGAAPSSLTWPCTCRTCPRRGPMAAQAERGG
ncbi:MAG: NnrS family protein [Massilia sp.]|nr:NnrS family protein [Massilia sp.]